MTRGTVTIDTMTSKCRNGLGDVEMTGTLERDEHILMGSAIITRGGGGGWVSREMCAVLRKADFKNCRGRPLNAGDRFTCAHYLFPPQSLPPEATKMGFIFL